MIAPTMKEIKSKFQLVLDNSLTRKEVSDWALFYLDNDETEVDDFEAWEYLKFAGAIDLFSKPNEYFYDENDIKSWINK